VGKAEELKSGDCGSIPSTEVNSSFFPVIILIEHPKKKKNLVEVNVRDTWSYKTDTR
jgi:hypothetical protein